MAGLRKTTLKNLLKVGFVLVAALLLMNPGPARADILLTLTSVTPVGPNFTYTYDVMLTSGSVLSSAGGGSNVYPGLASNNFFTLYDIQGLIPGSEVYAGILGVAGNSSFASKLLGDTPVTQTPIPPDSGTILNITTYWTGAPVTAGALPVDLGLFSFTSTNPLGSDMLAYSAATQKLEGLPDLLANNTAQVAGPGGPVGPPPIPEPATLALLAIGLPALGGFCYRRRKQ